MSDMTGGNMSLLDTVYADRDRLRAECAELKWWKTHGQQLRNAMVAAMGADEPCGDEDLLAYPHKLKQRAEAAERKCEWYRTTVTGMAAMAKMKERAEAAEADALKAWERVAVQHEMAAKRAVVVEAAYVLKMHSFCGLHSVGDMNTLRDALAALDAQEKP